MEFESEKKENARHRENIDKIISGMDQEGSRISSRESIDLRPGESPLKGYACIVSGMLSQGVRNKLLNGQAC